MIGTTGCKGLRIECVVGVYPQEREQPQPIVIDIELDYDFAPAASSDAVSDAVDYDRVVAGVAELVQRRRFHLIETMAEETADLLLECHASVTAVRLEIRKPNAIPNAESSFARLERSRR